MFLGIFLIILIVSIVQSSGYITMQPQVVYFLNMV